MNMLFARRLFGFKRPIQPNPSKFEEDAFEDALQDALLAQDRRTRRVGRWDWLNKPFTLWSLSTVVVGLFTFMYSNYSACRSALNTETNELHRIAQEISYRRSQFLRPNDPIDASADGMAALRRALDPELSYGRSEFKGKWSDELATEGETFLDKWRLVPRERGFGSQLSDEEERRYYFGLGLRKLFSSVYEAHSLSAEASKADDDEKRKLVIERYQFLVKMTLKDYDWIGKTMIFGWSDDGLASPIVCVRRSVWPF